MKTKQYEKAAAAVKESWLMACLASQYVKAES
jgi:hypothetical protein